ncbi:MAG: PspA/IM30 family protein [Fuerstiella sp.]|nr:PspA/IM30 family protein [Fuerstiella sp.]
MPYFTRLTDIVTCSLTEILDGTTDPEGTLREVIQEMEEGLSGARRSAQTADSNRVRIQRDIDEHHAQTDQWANQARLALEAGREDDARNALTRKLELEDLLGGLRPELDAAAKTHEHMLRIQKALEVRHSEALRRLSEVTGSPAGIQPESEPAVHTVAQSQLERQNEVEAELEALRKQLGT